MKIKNNQSFDNRNIPCYNCQLMGNSGLDSRDLPIAYCLLKNIIVAPEIGCNNPKLKENKK
jgi:hypothetical protein